MNNKNSWSILRMRFALSSYKEWGNFVLAPVKTYIC